MYESFYGLKENPFTILPDPGYLYLGKRYALAYTMLEYGVEHGAGFTVVTGDVGCGKTTLIRHLLDNLAQDLVVGLISNTRADMTDLMKWVLLSFDQPYESNDRVILFDQFQQFLIDQYSKGRRTVLIIDEAQNLSKETLEELRMLSNINADKHQLLQLVLVGQPQLKALLRRKEMEQLVQRVSSDFHISPLSDSEVAQYIQHRLQVAGREKPLFDESAIELIAAVSEGVPRKVNIFCDMALVYAFAAEEKMVSAPLVSEVLLDKAKYGVFGDVPNDVLPSEQQQQPANEPAAQAQTEQLSETTPFSDIDAFARKLFPTSIKK